MRDALWQHLGCSALLPVIVRATNSQTRLCSVRLLSAQQLWLVRDALWQDLCCSALLLVVLPLCEQQTFTSKLAMTKACYLLSALFCTTALISEGCTLAGSVLQCTVAGHGAFV